MARRPEGDRPVGGLTIGGLRRLTLAVLRHPGLWSTAVRQGLRLAAPGWWRRRPFLPWPDPAYLRFRLETAYGQKGDRDPDPADMIAYLSWCKAFPDR